MPSRKFPPVAYRFDPLEPTRDSLSRVALEELDSAIQLLDSSEELLSHRVHEARKHLKRLRALLALAEGAASRSAVSHVTRGVQKAARALANLRERAALLESFTALVRSSPAALEPAQVDRIRALLSSQEEGGSARDRDVVHAGERLGDARRRLTELRFHGSGWQSLEPGFRRTYSKARKAFLRASSDIGPEAIHSFRKPAKRHSYQVQLLEPLWPALLHPHRKELFRLGDLLGDHHDLCLLRKSPLLSALPSFDLEKLEELVRERSRELEIEGLALANRLFAERPAAMTRRFGVYFQVSRGQANHGAQGRRLEFQDAQAPRDLG